MKKLSLHIIIFISVFTTFAFSSCSNDDGYDLGNFVVSLATVNISDTSTGSYYLKMDDGTTLWAINQSAYPQRKNTRVWVNFTLLSDSISGFDHYVKINHLQEILTKDVIDLTAENEKAIGNDPITILDYWIGDHYLNIHSKFNVGGQEVHSVNLVKNTLQENSDEDNSITLELRHNANGDPSRYESKNYVAFDLRPFKKADKTEINFIIKVKDLNNREKKYRIEYKYPKDTNSKRIQ